MSPVQKLEKALNLLKEVGLNLQEESEAFYSRGDNHRGNIRHDAGRSLVEESLRLENRFSFVKKALEI